MLRVRRRFGRVPVERSKCPAPATQEIASGAAELSRMAVQLDELVRRFKVAA